VKKPTPATKQTLAWNKLRYGVNRGGNVMRAVEASYSRETGTIDLSQGSSTALVWNVRQMTARRELVILRSIIPSIRGEDVNHYVWSLQTLSMAEWRGSEVECRMESVSTLCCESFTSCFCSESENPSLAEGDDRDQKGTEPRQKMPYWYYYFRQVLSPAAQCVDARVRGK